MPDKTFKQTCECKHCGNEAEMIVTCSLTEAELDQTKTPQVVPQKEEGAYSGQAVCSRCGNESDIWLKY